MKSQEPRVVVDTRENSRSPDVAEKLKELGIKTEVQMLRVGDYLIPGYVVAERSTIPDLLSKVRSGRLWEQLDALKRAENVKPLLILEGSLAIIDKLGLNWKPQSILGVINAVELEYGIPVLTVPSKKWTVLALVQLAKKAVKENREPRTLRIKEKARTLEDYQRFVLSGLPGVDVTLAERILERFKTLRRVFSASEFELQKVDGIGENKAKKIIEVLDHEYRTSQRLMDELQ